MADVLFGKGYVKLCRYEYERSTKLHEEALELRRQQGEAWKVAQSLNALGILCRRFYQDEAKALRFFEQSMQISRAIHDRRGLSFQLSNLSNAAMEAGDHERARLLMQECLEICRELADPVGEAEALYSLATIVEAEGRDEYAYRIFLECLGLSYRFGDMKTVSGALWGIADYAIKVRRADIAACLLGVIDAVRTSLGAPFPPHWRPLYEKTGYDVRALLTPAAFSAHYERGLSLPIDKALVLSGELGISETNTPKTT